MAIFSNNNRVNVLAFGFAMGVTWGLGMFLLAIAASTMDWGNEVVELIGTVYLGVAASFKGAIAGAVWGFVDGLIAGIVFAWLYNWFYGKFKA